MFFLRRGWRWLSSRMCQCVRSKMRLVCPQCTAVRSHFCLEKDDLGSNIWKFKYLYCKIKLNMHWELKYLPVQSQSLTVVLHCLLTSILISYCSVCKLRPPPHHTTDPRFWWVTAVFVSREPPSFNRRSLKLKHSPCFVLSLLFAPTLALMSRDGASYFLSLMTWAI